ncbi:MAG: sugar ABC transporter ATP-binding protein, partial [Lachnospiraceae bacterium]|nr:sugar ABC transporter ATP-binding protein [Candidatus Equihabitans merdae]
MELAVKLENICKSFSGVTVLNNVNFELRKGEIHALMGANGAGKSTLIKILSGAYTKDSGKIFIEGKEVEIHNPVDSKANGIQCIYQELSLAPDLSIADNIFLGQEKMNGVFVDQKTIYQEAAVMMKDLDLDVNVRTKVSNIGIGEKFFTEISRCLVGKAKVVILDEPTSAMTPKEYAHFLKTIKT